MSKARKLRDLINAPEILVLPGVFDGFSARLVGASGFAAGFISGAGISEASLGWADVGVMGLEENLRVCRALVACCDLPLLADGDTGYGNAVNVHFVMRAFEQAGLAGLMIEDQVWPKRCGHMKGKEVISAEEGAEKIRAAADARRDPDTVIMSRTDALATHGIAEVIRRLNMYAEAGADLLFADAVLSAEHITAVTKNVSKPVCVNMGFGIRRRSTTPLFSARQLQDLGVGVVIYPRLLTAAAVKGMKNAMAALGESLKSGEAVDRPDLLVSFEELNALVGVAELEAIEQRYLTPEQFRRKYENATHEAKAS
ncbi:MAG TPA: isocitrate lyase/PEP mutase family protein [Xanthobacteraceae bacterium]|nr:isocitrate lyase/PEP mutase family protein [Xanthobacteraceae bacterium]